MNDASGLQLAKNYQLNCPFPVNTAPPTLASFKNNDDPDESSTNSLPTILELWCMSWMSTLFLMSVALLVMDVATGFGFFFSRFVPQMRSAAFAIGGILTALALVQGLRDPVAQSYDVRAIVETGVRS